MKRIFLLGLALGLSLLGTRAMAQEAYTEGPVLRVVLFKVHPGKLDEVTKWLQEHSKPIWEEEKREGVIVDYKVYVNTTHDSPADWDLGFTITYKSFAALDGLQAKTQPITRKHFGSEEAQREAFSKVIADVDLVSSRLVREIDLK